MKKEKGFILYKGQSLIDGKPIIVIATMKTNNPKTGDMVQTWIMREDIAPHLAVKNGDDISVCGDCIHRPALGNTCYVTTFQAPLSVWKSYHNGNYSTDLTLLKSLLPKRKLRIGAYGDPAACPTSVWAELATLSMGNTGYTHQWERSEFDPDLLDYVMASVDTEKQAKSIGARYFRVIPIGAKPLPREIECLSDSMGKSCADCLLCDGGNKGKSVYITAHGKGAANYNPDLLAIG